MINTNDNQRTLSWFRARLGNITGSRCGDLMKSGRRKEDTFGDTAKSYIMQLAAERMLNPVVVDDDELFAEYVEFTSVSSKAMRFGTEQEEAARSLFARMAGVTVIEPSSCRHDTLPHFAASPDGIILDAQQQPIACLEIKCPKIDTFVKYLDITDGPSLKDINSTYYWQTQAEMMCTGTSLCYFVVYSPFLTHPLHVALIERDEEDVSALSERITLADTLINQIANERQSPVPRVLSDLHQRAASTSLRLAE